MLSVLRTATDYAKLGNIFEIVDKFMSIERAQTNSEHRQIPYFIIIKNAKIRSFFWSNFVKQFAFENGFGFTISNVILK